MRIGILGANGFLGSNLCKKYLSDGNEVFAFYHHNRNLIPEGCKVLPYQKISGSALDCLIISIGGYDGSHNNYLDQYQLLYNVVKNEGFKKIVFFSSTEVYGAHTMPIQVNTCFNAPKTYGLAKLAQEFLIKSCARFSIIRPTYIYGSGMKRNSLIPIWVEQALKHKEFSVFGDGQRLQDYLHIDDLCNLCKEVSNSDLNDVILAASGISTSNKQVAEHIRNMVLGSNIKYIGTDVSPSFQFDISKTIEAYNWKPKKTLGEGLKDYIAHENFNL
jgi:UDP-glucose 4-epimerase